MAAKPQSKIDRCTCSYKQCQVGKTTEDSFRCEVKTFQPKSVSKSKLLVDWDEEWEAVFHLPCWKMLCNPQKSGIVLDSTEKEMIKEASKTAEFFNSSESIKKEAARVAQMLKNASHCIAFTGAGISTAAGIGDFRGKSGKWTEQERSKKHGPSKSKSRGFSYVNLRPTYTHEALCKLMEMGILKHVISQNTDGLHRLSGIPRDKISELHGNTYIEKCESCDTRYERPYPVRSFGGQAPPKRCTGCGHNHRTGAKCEKTGCRGYLMNTIINFGDNLETAVLTRADKEAQRNDLVLCLGTTLRVSPANSLVELGKKPVRLVICNRQTTPYDDFCYDTHGDQGQVGSRVFGDCDVLMKEVMKCILSQDALQEWEEGREDRMEEYDKQRFIPS